jgi:hypothetical protein
MMIELPKELVAALEELKLKLQSAEGGSAEELAKALDLACETGLPEAPPRPGWKARLAAWWRNFKQKASSLWDRATQAVKRLMQRLAATVSKLTEGSNRNWMIAGLAMVAAIAVVLATVKSFALIVALLAAFGLLALVRVIQRLQDGLVL